MKKSNSKASLNNSMAQHTQPQFSQSNWLAYNKNSQWKCIHEFPVFSDADIVGDIQDGFGPYKFINTIPNKRQKYDVAASFVLRVEFHLDVQNPDDNINHDVSRYHGGSVIDEIISLLSLSMGVRLRTGGESRVFYPPENKNNLFNDPLGRPCSWNDQPHPYLLIRNRELLLPEVSGKHSLDDAALLKSIPHFPQESFINLIKASRLYQDALWVAESEPNLAWLFLVSSLEVAANDFIKKDFTSEEKLRDWNEQLASMLDQAGGTEHTQQVAKIIDGCFGSTKKFTDFSLKFMPEERTIRPSEKWLQVDWGDTSLKKTMKMIYGYRSKALHVGTPFPVPMMEPPFYMESNSVPSEKPLTGIKTHAKGGTWGPEECPMNLHCFHYITRNILLKWWKHLLGQ